MAATGQDSGPAASGEPPGASGPARAGRTRTALFWNQRLAPVLITATAMLLLFTGFRLGLLAANWGKFEENSPGVVARCLVIGLRYDAVPLGYAMLPLVLALSLVPRAVLGRRGFRKAVTIYATVLVGTTAVVEIVGAAFFLRFALRLNWIALTYVRHVREVGGYIWYNYPVLLVLPLIVLVFWGAYRLFLRVLWVSRPGIDRGWPLAVQAAVLAGLCILACRGGFTPHPLRFAPAYYSSNNLLSQLALNNYFTLFYAVRSMEQELEGRQFHVLPPEAQARRQAMDLLFQAQDRALGSSCNPLWRRTDTGRPRQDYNVVVILMEGMSGRPVGALGHRPSHTPRLDALCREGLYFENLYASGARTSRAIIGVLCGHPDLDGVSVLKQEQAQGAFLTLPSVFRQRGYHTSFIYGGDPDFDNMRQFLLRDGVDEVLGDKDMKAEKFAATWGVTDEVVLRRAHEYYRQRGDGPFFSIILTLSNHEAYHVPKDRTEMLPGDDEDTNRLNAYRYADWALGQFFDTIRQADYFRRTIFVLVADHGHHMDSSRIIDVPGYRVPCLFYAPGIVQPGTVSALGGQADIPPTLLAMLGGSFDHCFMGRNLLAVDPADGFAFLHGSGGDCLGFLRNGYVAILPPDTPKALLFASGPMTMDPVQPAGSRDDQRQRLQLEMLSYYMMAQQLYQTRSYRKPADVPN